MRGIKINEKSGIKKEIIELNNWIEKNYPHVYIWYLNHQGEIECLTCGTKTIEDTYAVVEIRALEGFIFIRNYLGGEMLIPYSRIIKITNMSLDKGEDTMFTGPWISKEDKP